MAGRLSKKKIKDALEAAEGILAVAAKRLNCTRQTIYNWEERYPEIREFRYQVREGTTDWVENELIKNCKKGKESSIFYYLNNLGRNRGYGKPTAIALTDPTGTKEYGQDARNAILGKLFPELTE